MGFEFEKEEYYYNDENNGSSTPKLCLYNTFSSKKLQEPLGMVTPPLRSFPSIPFKWEEVPGKPRSTGAAAGATTTTNSTLPKSKTVRCLVPPPRLANNSTSKVTDMPSPTTVLDGPGPYTIGWSVSSSGSGRSFWSPEGQERDSKEKFSSSSCRRGSCNESRGNGVGGIMDISSVVDINNEDKVKSTKIRRIRRRSNSFLIVSATSSKVLSSIYESFKQAVPWKRMPERLRRMSS